MSVITTKKCEKAEKSKKRQKGLAIFHDPEEPDHVAGLHGDCNAKSKSASDVGVMKCERVAFCELSQPEKAKQAKTNTTQHMAVIAPSHWTRRTQRR